MAVTLGFAGDTMLGRGVGEVLAGAGTTELWSPALRDLAGSADLVLVNLECCISNRGQHWPDPDKAFFFRAPPVATLPLRQLGVRCVNLANNHALDYGRDALGDTFDHLAAAGPPGVTPSTTWPRPASTGSAPVRTPRGRGNRGCSPWAVCGWVCWASPTTRPSTRPDPKRRASRTSIFDPACRTG